MERKKAVEVMTPGAASHKGVCPIGVCTCKPEKKGREDENCLLCLVSFLVKEKKKSVRGWIFSHMGTSASIFSPPSLLLCERVPPPLQLQPLHLPTLYLPIPSPPRQAYMEHDMSNWERADNSSTPARVVHILLSPCS